MNLESRRSTVNVIYSTALVTGLDTNSCIGQFVYAGFSVSIAVGKDRRSTASHRFHLGLLLLGAFEIPREALLTGNLRLSSCIEDRDTSVYHNLCRTKGKRTVSADLGIGKAYYCI